MPATFFMPLLLLFSASVVGINDFFRATSPPEQVLARNVAVKKKIAYTPPTEYLLLDQKRKAKVIDKLKRNIAKLDIKPEDVGFVIT